MKPEQPPRLARRLARLLIPEPHRDAVLDDLEEDFRRTLRARGARVARRRYWSEVVRARPFAWRRQKDGREPRPASRGAAWWASVGQDIRVGLRSIRSRPGFAATVITTFALGIGTTTAVFSVVDAVLIEPLPYQHPEELVAVWNRLEELGLDRARVSGPDFLDYRREVSELHGVAGIWVGPSTLTGVDRAERLLTAKVTENLFEVLGVTLHLGRPFREGEGSSMDFTTLFDRETERISGAIVLSHPLWVRRFGSDPGVIGSTVRMAGLPVTVVGVLQPDFTLRFPAGSGIPQRVDVFEAFRSTDLATNPRGARWLTVVGRLGSGATIDRARASLERVAAEHRATFQGHAEAGVHAAVASFQREVSREAAPTLMLLLGAVGLVFLIACANVTNLQLVRALGRRQEMAVRVALGGSRARIIRQVVTDNGILAVIGGGTGVLVASSSVDALRLVQPDALAHFSGVTLDLSVLGFALAITALGALASCVVPAFVASAGSGSDWLRQRSATSSRRTARIHTGLVVGELALSLVLLMAASVMVNALTKLGDIDPGFEADGVIAATIALPEWGYRDRDARLAVFQLLGERLQGLPGVEAVGAADRLPLTDGANTQGDYWLAGDDRQAASGRRAVYRGVLPGYFAAIGTKVTRGRAFEMRDMREDTPPVAIVDDAFAAQNWPTEDPIGKRIEVVQFDWDVAEFTRAWKEVVGVAESVRFERLAVPPIATIYLPMSSYLTTTELTVAIRSAATPASIMQRVRSDLASIDPNIAVADPVPLEAYLADDTAVLRFLIALAGGFAALAIVLAALGLYGTIAYLVRERTAEIAIRMAFGADGPTVMRMVLRRGMALGTAGVALGMAGGIGAARVLEDRVLGVSGAGPMTIILAGSVLVAVALTASFLPARRAARVDPMVSLRRD